MPGHISHPLTILLALNVLFKLILFQIRLQNICRTYDVLVNLLKNSSENPHIVTNDNIQELWNDLNENDKGNFFFDLKQFHWSDYLEVYYDGVLEFVLKEEVRDNKLAKRHFLK